MRTKMNNPTKAKTVTFRLNDDLHQKCITTALTKSNKENRIVKLSEIIRDALNDYFDE